MRGLSMLAFLPMLIIIATLYFAFHLLIYYSSIRFFGIQSQFTRNFIAVALLFLGTSFFISSALTHVVNSFITRGYYVLSAVWVGSMIYIGILFAVAWVAVLVTKTTGNATIMITVGVIVLISASMLSVYSLWNAQHPRMKSLTVKIEKLPEQWKKKKVVFVSDVHLGFVYREQQAKEMVTRINNEKPDIIFIGGDLFDGSDGDLDWVRNSIKDLYATDGIFYITGNHETYLGIDKALEAINKTNIQVLCDEKVVIDGMQIIGFDYPKPGEQKDIRDILVASRFDKSEPSILLSHAPIQVQEAADAGVSLQLSGHTHLGQIFPFALITRLVYKGYDYGLKNIGNFQIYTSNGFGTWGPPMRSGNIPEIVAIDFE